MSEQPRPDGATAFVPGHVTGFFSPHPDDDPERAGSRGAGLTLSDGVHVTVRSVDDDTSGITLDGEARPMPAVETVLSTLGVAERARVVAESELPLGTGFGVSGAMALGTALAANRVFDCARSANALITLAHRAEVLAGSGLGDVVAQARGGVPIRLDPGGPGHGRLDAVPDGARVEYLALGERSTADVLDDDTDPLRAAGEAALSRLLARPTLPTLLDESRRFAREAGLVTDRLAPILGAVDDAGGAASMAMLGETAFAVGTGLSDAGYDPAVCRTSDVGAHLLAPERP